MRKYLLGLAVFVLAFGVFSVSVLHCSSVSKVFATTLPIPKPTTGSNIVNINYDFPFSGTIMPDNPLWSLKAIRDWVWYYFTLDPLKKAELALLFSDKRLMASKYLFENDKPDIAISTLSKGEKYLEIAVSEEKLARDKGAETSVFLKKLALASLKHRQVIDEEMLHHAPEDGKPDVIKSEDYARNAYKTSRDALNSRGLETPKSPFEGQ